MNTDEVKMELILNKEHVYFNFNGIYTDIVADEEGYELLKEAFTPMIEELQQYAIMINVQKELAG